MHSFQLLLASASPRRAAILETIGLPFTLVTSSFEEPPPTPEDGRQPAAYVMRLAREKAAHAALPTAKSESTRLVLSADTIVWHEGEILGKPRDEADSRAMLRRLSGQSHQVFTGICLRLIDENNGQDEFHISHDSTTVQFRDVSDVWIARYVATGEPLDKAGSYAAQGLGAVIVERIQGDFWNVVGLPLARLTSLLETVGAPLDSWWGKNSG